MNNSPIILASSSPRRKQLLQQIGIFPECLAPTIDETQHADETPWHYCQRLALEKAQAGWQQSKQKQLVLGSDTIVVLHQETLGKPKDAQDAARMLKMLSAQTHQVMTAVALVFADKYKAIVNISNVEFAHISRDEIKHYIATQEPMDKAGAYAIQGYAARWIKNISGSYSGIMGLPLYETAQLITTWNREL